LPDFGKRLKVWWDDMQPTARKTDTGKLELKELSYDQWSTSPGVFRWGRYGISIVVLSVAWLRIADDVANPDGDEEKRTRWTELAEDVTWALEQMAALPLPISGGSTDTANPKPKRYTGSKPYSSHPLKTVCQLSCTSF
jgi:hypothetical protein